MEVEVSYDNFLKKWVIAHYDRQGMQLTKTDYAFKRGVAVTKARQIMHKTGHKVKIYTRSGELARTIEKYQEEN